MFKKFLDSILGDYNENQLKPIYKQVEQINLKAEEYTALDDEALKNNTVILKKRIADGETVDDVLVDAFATVKEACRRLVGTKYVVAGEEIVWDMIPYDVQMIGGIVLNNWKIAEMKTGEGKTLVALSPVYLNALTGKGVHIVTVNNYLTRRDCEWMKLVYEWLGLTVGCITKETPVQQRKEEYQKDITYVENSELWFDYLRDNLVKKSEERCLLTRPLNYAIVDEIDSILIDEARTPLIISIPVEWSVEKYQFYNNIIKELKPCSTEKKVSKGKIYELLNPTEGSDEVDGDYYIDVKGKSVSITEAGIEKIEKMLGVNNIYQDLWYQELSYVENALKAHGAYVKDKDYIVEDDEILIVDEHTGRTMKGRRFGEGLHQAIEAKENVKVQDESMTIATITYQNFFKQYNKLAGMTGTAVTEAEEFSNFYNLEVVVIPTNKEILRVDLNDKVYLNQKTKWNYVKEYIKFYHTVGVPILLGTADIDTSEHISRILTKENIVHSVLNAKNHSLESKIISNAWKEGSVIVATNMAGRGTDIKLDKELNQRLAKNYAEYFEKIMKTWKGVDEVNKMNLNIYSEKELNLLLNALEGNKWIKENCLIEKKLLKRNKKKYDVDDKEKIYANLSIILKEKEINIDTTLEYDIFFWLLVIGTEKHDSRRIDNQLRGRSGRQGDPWASVFFVSLDDNLMKKSGMNKITAILGMFWLMWSLDGMELKQAKFTNAIKRTQKEIEGYYFGIRKHLFDYDTVINKQREKIYRIRNFILDASIDKEKREKYVLERNETFLESAKNIIQAQIITFISNNDSQEELLKFLVKNYGLSAETPEEIQFLSTKTTEEIIQLCFQRVEKYFRERVYKLVDIDNLFDLYSDIHLFYLDKLWIEHIDEMQRLKEQVSFAGYAQQDPLLMYKKQSYEKFLDFYTNIENSFASYIMRVDFERAISMIEQKNSWNIGIELTKDEFEYLKEVVKNNPDSDKGKIIYNDKGEEILQVTLTAEGYEELRKTLKEKVIKAEEESLKAKIDSGEIKVTHAKDKKEKKKEKIIPEKMEEEKTEVIEV